MELKGKTVLLTGGSGFLGGYVVEELKRKEVKHIVIPSHKFSDLRDRREVRWVVSQSNPDVVIHLAAVCGGIGANQKNPGKFFYDNLKMGIELIDECREQGIQKFVQVGTVCAYPKHTPVPFKEEDLWNGYPEETNAPYGIAKKALLVMAQAYRQQYNMNAIYLLPVNLYGPKDNFDLESSHVIPALIRKFIEAKKDGRDTVEVWGTGSAFREFMYARDCARGIVLATEKYDGAEPINLGTGREVSIKHLVEIVALATGYTGKVVWNTSKPDGQPRRCLDITKAQEKFGFHAETPLAYGIMETVKWYVQSLGEHHASTGKL